MSTSVALYNEFRPYRFEDLFQQHIVESLTHAVKSNDVHPCMIFAGDKGAGKTTYARTLAMALNCLNRKPDEVEPCGECESCQLILADNRIHPNVHEINAAQDTGIDAIREIEGLYTIIPRVGKYRIFIMDEAHQLSTSAQNALLKPLEEPPASVRFILCTTKLAGLLDTIQSRSFIYQFKKIDITRLTKLLEDICGSKGWEHEVEALRIAALAAEGSPRNAVKYLSQLHTVGIDIAHANDLLGFSSLGLGVDILEAVINSNPIGLVKIVDAIASDNKDFSMVLKCLENIIYNMIMIAARGNVDLPPEIIERRQNIGGIIRENKQRAALLGAPSLLIEMSKEMGYHNIAPKVVLLSGLLKLESSFRGEAA